MGLFGKYHNIWEISSVIAFTAFAVWNFYVYSRQRDTMALISAISYSLLTISIIAIRIEDNRKQSESGNK